MEGFLPFTKSFNGDVKMCPWKACQHKVCGIKSRSGKAAMIGLDTHKVAAAIRQGQYTLDAFLEAPKRFFNAVAFSEDELSSIIEMVQRAFSTDPILLSDTEKERLRIEEYFLVDAKGQLTKDRKKAILSGIKDREFLRDDGSAHVDDLKTERYPRDNPLERYCYILGASAQYPTATQFTFGLHYLRTGNYIQWRYELLKGNGKNKGKVGLIETSPSGEKQEFWFGQNPLLMFVNEAIAKIERTEAKPNPGPHCESWYGEPCQFLGKECPLAEAIPAVVDAELPNDPEDLSPSGLLKAIADTPNLPATKEQIEWAKAGAIQLEGFVKRLNLAIAAWSKTNGPVMVGETKYGWFTGPENDVDKVFALTEMLRSMSIEDVAKAISISKNSIATKISKREYPTVREMLLEMAVSTRESKPKFGAIKNEITEDEE